MIQFTGLSIWRCSFIMSSALSDTCFSTVLNIRPKKKLCVSGNPTLPSKTPPTLKFLVDPKKPKKKRCFPQNANVFVKVLSIKGDNRDYYKIRLDWALCGRSRCIQASVWWCRQNMSVLFNVFRPKCDHVKEDLRMFRVFDASASFNKMEAHLRCHEGGLMEVALAKYFADSIK